MVGGVLRAVLRTSLCEMDPGLVKLKTLACAETPRQKRVDGKEKWRGGGVFEYYVGGCLRGARSDENRGNCQESEGMVGLTPAPSQQPLPARGEEALGERSCYSEH